MATIDTGEPLAVAVVEAIQSGDIPALQRLLAEHPGLAEWLRARGARAAAELHTS